MNTPEMTPGLVSVVVPTYNQKGFVRQTLDSVLAQTYPSFEVIVADDASTDGTAVIVSEYADRHPDRIRPLYGEINLGINRNLNRALRVCRGEYLAWLGGDDLMYPEKLEKQVALLSTRPDAVGCCHDAEVFDSDSGHVYGVFSELYNGRRGFREGGVELWFEPDYYMLPSTVMVRRRALPDHGFDERLQFNDWMFDVEIFRCGRCAVLNEVLGGYRRHGANITASETVKSKGFEETLLALALLESRYPDLVKLIRKKRLSMYIAEAARAYKRQDIPRSNAYIVAAIRGGARMRGVAAYLGLRAMGSYISRQLDAQHYGRPKWFLRVTRLVKGGL